MKIIKNKKGFSIAEVVIAMAIIAIVSASALTVVTSTAQNTQTAMYKADAQYLVYDALECFKTSQTPEEFGRALAFRGDVLPIIATDNSQFYKILDSGYDVQVLVNYETSSPSNPAIKIDTFTILVNNSKGETVASITDYRRLNIGGQE